MKQSKLERLQRESKLRYSPKPVLPKKQKRKEIQPKVEVMGKIIDDIVPVKIQEKKDYKSQVNWSKLGKFYRKNFNGR